MKIFIGRVRVQGFCNKFTMYYTLHESVRYPGVFIFRTSFSSLASARHYCDKLVAINNEYEYEYIGKIVKDEYNRGWVRG